MSTVCSGKGNPVRHARPSTALRIDSGGHPGWTAKELDSRFRGNECARKGRYISMVKVHAGVCHNSVAEGNCVAARRGGEQPEANCRSVG